MRAEGQPKTAASGAASGWIRRCASRLWASTGVRLWSAYLLVSLVYTAPLLRHPTYAGFHLDWRFFHYLNEASRRTILEFGQFPLWNPWGCGGNVHLANPQTQFLSPYFALYLLFGVAVGQKLFVLIHYWLGFVGMHLLVVRSGRTHLAAAASALVFGLCGFHAMRAGGGHAAFLPFLYLPWVLLAYRASLAEMRHALLLGLLFTATLFEGGVYPLAFFVLLLAFEAIYDTISGSNPRWRPAAAGAVAAIVFVVTGSVKLGPVLQYLGEAPRLVPLDDRLDLTLFFKAFLSRSLERHLPGHEYVWHEYINYVGPLPLLAAVVMWPRRDEEPLRRWYFALAIFSLLMLGDQGWLSPYALLHKLPIFRSLRVPSRFGVLVDLHLALLFGVFANWLDFRCERLSERVRVGPVAWMVRRGAPLAVLATALDMGLTNARLFSPGFTFPPRPAVQQPLFQGQGNGNDMWWRVRQNEGTPHCYEVNPVPTASGLWLGRRPQVRLEAGRGEVVSYRATPNRWSVEVQLREADTLLVNQNHHRFWRLSGPGRLVSRRGLLAVELPAGRHRLELWYWPDNLALFAASTLAGLPASVLAWWWLGRTRRRRGGGT